MTPLFTAVTKENVEIVKLLLTNDDININISAPYILYKLLYILFKNINLNEIQSQFFK